MKCRSIIRIALAALCAGVAGTAPVGLAVAQSSVPVPLDFEPRTYRMVSVPYDLNDASFEAVLFDDYGPYNLNLWRLFHYNPILGSYDEFPDTDVDFSRGTAVWIVNQNGTSFDLDQPLQTNFTDPLPVVVYPGWNQVGMPFPFPIACRALLDEVPALVPEIDNIEGPVFYDGTEFKYNVDTCDPWEGYFIYIDTPIKDEPLFLAIPPLGAFAARPADAAGGRSPVRAFDASSDFMLRLSARQDGTGLRDTENYVGFLGGAADGVDANDFREAPPVGEFVQLFAREGDVDLAGNFKAPDENGDVWHVVIRSTRPGEPVEVRMEPSGVLPDDFEIHVLDEDRHSAIAVVDGSFRVGLSSEGSALHLAVIVGTRAFAEIQAGEISLVPSGNELRQNFPNPFGSGTAIDYRLARGSNVSLRVFNILGQEIRRLDEGFRDAGTHRVLWDGRDDSGTPVANGFYLYRLDSAEFSRTLKMTRLR